MVRSHVITCHLCCVIYGSVPAVVAGRVDRRGMPVNGKRVQRLMRAMGLRAIYRRPGASRRAPERPVYPYLLRNVRINRPNQVWAADITYLPMARGFLYLAAVMDWHSRYVLAWRLSNTLETGFCAGALRRPWARASPRCSTPIRAASSPAWSSPRYSRNTG